MNFFTIALALAATAFAAPKVVERQNVGCFGAGQECISVSDCCNYQTGAGGQCVWADGANTGKCT